MEVLVDPFRRGDDINTRIDTLDIQALVFLSSPASVRSRWCLQELEAARNRRIPVFTARLGGRVLEEFGDRVFPDFRALSDTEFAKEIASMALAIHSRARLYRAIKALPDQAPELSREAAKRLAAEKDRTALAEFVRQLGDQFSRVRDPTTQGWIARAIGHSATPEAGEVLLQLYQIEHDLHPYALHAIAEGLKAVCQEIPEHRIAHRIKAELESFGRRKETRQ